VFGAGRQNPFIAPAVHCAAGDYFGKETPPRFFLYRPQSPRVIRQLKAADGRRKFFPQKGRSTEALPLIEEGSLEKKGRKEDGRIAPVFLLLYCKPRIKSLSTGKSRSELERASISFRPDSRTSTKRYLCVFEYFFIWIIIMMIKSQEKRSGNGCRPNIYFINT
jgi:hypothetical protein